MDAVKCTGSEMHDTNVNRPAIVGRPFDLTRCAREVCLREEFGHYSTTPVFQIAISRSSLSSLRAGLPDAVSSTALVAAGATLLLFTTGRGTPLGFPVPTLKIASNSALARKKPRWIDFDAGQVLEGTSMDEAARELMRLVIETASGKPARNELNDEREIAIWKTGVVL